jgi:flavodoxin
MKVLIVYFSYAGNNEILAKEIQKKLLCDTLQILDSNKRNGFTILLDILFDRKPSIQSYEKNIKTYDHIIFIAPIWASKIASPLKSFLRLEKNNIPQYSFITACSGYAGQKEKIAKDLIRLIEKQPTIVTELWINDLLPADQKNKIKYVTPYRLQPKDLVVFEAKIEKHIRAISN